MMMLWRSFGRLNDAEFYRYVDDMAIAVDTEVIGKKALKTMTELCEELEFSVEY